ncbi:MAG TPA: ABC transporter substrate-binding protein [Myxococcaceae bacterium]|nr:ABC transporter substrate-binding protein [Myxococcaceae bacterium]
MRSAGRRALRRRWMVGVLGMLLLTCVRSTEPGAPLRVGYLTNLTHAQALVGQVEGAFGPGVELVPFGAGPAAMEALASGSLDAAYMGPAPALIGWHKADHELVVLSAAVNNGAGLVTREARSAQELRGGILAFPQIGNTQDVALRTWLADQGLEPGKDVKVVPTSNASILGLFMQGQLDGAWVPEPWASRLELQAGATLMVPEASVWPDGRFHTTLLVTRKEVLAARPQELQALLEAHVGLTREWQQAPDAFRDRVLSAFEALTGQAVSPEVGARAFSRLRPALEPEASLLQRTSDDAASLGYLPSGPLTGLVDPHLLEQARRAVEREDATRKHPPAPPEAR